MSKTEKEKRIEFGNKLRETFVKAFGGDLKDANVYFQPPENTRMKFPCIVYRRQKLTARHADNFPYLNFRRYQVTAIDTNPDSKLVDELSIMPKCMYDRQFISDNIYHDVFNIYY